MELTNLEKIAIKVALGGEYNVDELLAVTSFNLSTRTYEVDKDIATNLLNKLKEVE